MAGVEGDGPGTGRGLNRTRVQASGDDWQSVLRDPDSALSVIAAEGVRSHLTQVYPQLDADITHDAKHRPSGSRRYEHPQEKAVRLL